MKFSDQYCKNIGKASRKRNTLEMFIKMYGKIEGTEKYKKYKNKLSKSGRIGRIKHIEDNYGIAWPNFNKKACEVFKEFDEINKTQGRYAMYGGGEFRIHKLGYSPDYINFDLKLIIEIDEKKTF